MKSWPRRKHNLNKQGGQTREVAKEAWGTGFEQELGEMVPDLLSFGGGRQVAGI